MNRFKAIFPGSEALRFLVAGGANTCLTIGVYWFILNWFSYPIAYAASYAFGVVSSYMFNTYLVFKSRWSWLKLLAFPSVHAVNFLAGMAVMWLLVSQMGISQIVAPIIASIVVLPINFVLTKRLIQAGGKGAT